MTLNAVRRAYVVGAIFDLVIAIVLLFPSVMAPVFDLAETPQRLPERLGFAMTAVLLFGWTALLLWGAQEPIARRSILLMTVVPVIAGLASVVLWGWLGGYVSTTGAAPIWISQAALSALFLSAFVAADRHAASGPDRP